MTPVSAASRAESPVAPSRQARGRVLIANNYLYRRGGAEVVALEQARLLSSRGVTVAPFAMRHPRNEPSPYERFFPQEIEYGESYSPARAIVNSVRVVHSFEAAARMRALIDHFQPDLLHAHNVYHHLSPSVLQAARRRGVPVVLTLHDLKLLCPAYQMLSHGEVCEQCKPHRVHHLLLRRCMKDSLAVSGLVFIESLAHRMSGIYRRSVDLFVSPSLFLRDKFVEWGWDPARIRHVPNFVAADAIVPAEEVGDAFLYFGRLSPEKGVETLLRAAAAAGAPLWIAGSGPTEAPLRALAEQLGADVRFFGHRVGDELWALVRACRAVVLPSQWYENAPLSLLEAMAHGKPVIGARIGGIPEMLVAQDGALFEPGDVDALATVLAEHARRSPALLLEQGRRAREYVLRAHSAQAHLEALAAVYTDVGAKVAW